jgi:hypothetical protein
MKTTYHIIQEILFNTEDQAGKLYETNVSSKAVGFRKKHEHETWSAFEEAFRDYMYTDEVAYDPCNWEIHWYKLSVRNDALGALVDLYFAIVNHASIETLVDDDVRGKLKDVQRIVMECGIKA